MALEAIVLSQLDPFLGGIGNSSTTAAAGSSMLNHYYDLLGTATTGLSTPPFLDPFNKFPVSNSSTSFCYGGVYENETTNRCIHNINSVASNTVGSSSCCSTATAINNNYYHESLIISSSSPVGNNPNVFGGGGGGTSTTTTTTHDQVWDHHQLYGPSITSHNYVYSSSSSPPNHNHTGGGCASVALVDHSSSQGHCCCCCCCRDNDQEVVIVTPPPTVLSNGRVFGKIRKRRRRCTTKNKEEVENQRMTHIAVERNRRKQMNDYLSVIRSLMPSSYVQRGDQASIVGGAINYVKELEQLLQSLESQKRKLPSTPRHQQPADDNYQSKTNIITEDAANNTSPFANFFSFPQYSKTKHGSTFSSTTLSSDHDNINNNYNYQETVNETAAPAAEGEIEVTTAENHANVKILSKKQPRQLLKLVAGFQSLRLSVLHLNVTSTHDHFVLYSFSLKVEEGCSLSSVDEIASAANHILGS